MIITIEQQLIILYVLFFVVSVILIIWSICLCYSVQTLKKYVKTLTDQENRRQGNLHPYNLPTVPTDQEDELRKRGFSTYEGQILPRLESTGGGFYGAPKTSTSMQNIHRDFIPINDQLNRRDSMNELSSTRRSFTFDTNRSQQPDYEESQNNSQQMLVSNFNSNFVMASPTGQNTEFHENNNNFMNNRVMNRF